MDYTQKTQEELLNELTPLIETELEFCNSNETPTICQMTGTPEGMAKVVQLVLDRIIISSMTIAAAIVDIEREFNSNRPD